MERTAEVKALLPHGIDNEENAEATVIGKVMSVIKSDLVFCEEGCVELYTENGEPFVVVSHDRSLMTNETLSATKVPPRYMLQCLSEIKVLCIYYLIYNVCELDEAGNGCIQSEA